MDFKLNLQTGFYKKTAYNLKIKKHKVILTPLNSSDTKITQILDENIIAVVFGDRKNLEIEIQTYSCNYTGSFDKDTDMADLLGRMKENLRTDFICKGGR